MEAETERLAAEGAEAAAARAAAKAAQAEAGDLRAQVRGGEGPARVFAQQQRLP